MNISSGSLEKHGESRVCPSAVLVIFCLVFFAVVAYFLKFSYEGLREEYALRLTEEKSIVETNKKLATELKALTETRYLEFKARERLGLKKPKEEEVLVVR